MSVGFHTWHRVQEKALTCAQNASPSQGTELCTDAKQCGQPPKPCVRLWPQDMGIAQVHPLSIITKGTGCREDKGFT